MTVGAGHFYMARLAQTGGRDMNYKKLNCKNCGYKYCPFHGVEREIPAYFCEDYEPAEEGEK